MFKKYIFHIVCFFATGSYLYGQCNLIRNIPLADYDTTIVSIVVDSLENSILGENGQGLCGVGIDFRHEFIGDITMELVSPGGTNVTLTGPAVPVSGNTSFTRWNINFVPCSQLPSPDPGFSEIWDNLQPWGLFGNYTGQYHPFSGCLEDFESGQANGVWTLRIIDVSQFGSGRIQAVRLFFCDDTGINCQECRLDPGILSGPAIEQCQSGTGVKLSGIQESFALYPKDTLMYDYRWAIFNDSSLIDVVAQDTILHLPSGNFNICNLQSAKIETDVLPGLPVTMNIQEINNYFQEALACARMGDSCLRISIFPSTDTILMDTSICNDAKLVLFGDTIAQPGIYSYSIQGEFCDSVIILTVVQKEFNVSVTSNNDSLNCFFPVLQLNALVNGERDQGMLYSWMSPNGGIISDPTNDSILINLPGFYIAEVTDGICTDKDSVYIYKSDDLPEVTILGFDTLTCNTDTLVLSIFTNVVYDTVIWSSDAPFIQENNEIKVYEAGVYTAEVISTDGCLGFAFTEIINIETVPPFYVDYDSLSCGKDTATAIVMHETEGSFSYLWTGTLSEFQNSFSVKIIQGGLKSLVVTDNSTGCTSVYAFELPDTRLYASGEVLADTITCSNDSAEVKLIPDMEVVGYLWQGSGLFSRDSVVIIRMPGDYTVEITTFEGCVTTIPFQVVADTLPADITLFADSLSCSADSVSIQVESNMVITSYTWFDRNGLVFNTGSSPWVNMPGVYTLQAVNEAGCLTFASVEIIKSSELPDISFTYGMLSCAFDSVQIIPDRTDGLWFNWEFPDSSVSSSPFPFVDEPGRYKVTITDILNPSCVVYEEILIEENRDYPTINISQSPLTCFQDSALIEVRISPERVNFYISGPSFYIENQDSFYVKRTGMYEIVVVTDAGCEARDTFFVFLDGTHPIINVQPFEPITCNNPASRLIFDSNIPGTNFELYQEGELAGSGNSVWVNIPGEYHLIGISPNFCRDTVFFTVEADTVKPDLFVIPPDTITCLRSEIVLNASSAFPDVLITWNGMPQNPLIVSSGGLYTVRTVNNENGCFIEQTINVAESKVSAGYQAFSTKLNCNNALANVRIEPGPEFENIVWSFDNPVYFPQGTLYFQTPLSGWYYFDVISTAMCITRDSIFVEQDIYIPEIGVIHADEINCSSPSSLVYATILTPYDSIKWYLPDGNRLTVDSLLTNQSGLHLIRVFGQNGCVLDTFVEVIKNITLPTYSVITDSLSCSKGKAVLEVISSDSIDSYIWTGPEQFFETLQQVLVTIPGTYTLVIANQNGCRDTSRVEVKGDYKMPEFVIRDTFYIPCDSSLIRLDVEKEGNIIAYYWSFEETFLSSDSVVYSNKPGNYSVRLTGNNGCTSEKNFILIQVLKPVDFTVQSDTIRCNKPVANLKAVAGDSGVIYTWVTPSSQLLSGSMVETRETGLFQLIVQDKNNCTDTVEVMVLADTLTFRTEIEQEGEIVCNQREVVLHVKESLDTSTYSYRWFNLGGHILTNPELTEVTVRDQGLYRFIVVNKRNGCSGVSEKKVEETESFFREIPVEVKQPPCKNFNFGSIFIGGMEGIPPYLFELNGAKYSNVFDYHFLQPGEFSLSVTDSLGCKIDTVFRIESGTDPVIDLPTDTTLVLGDSLVIALDTAYWKTNGYTIQLYERNDLICDDSCVFPFTVRPGNATVFKLLFETEDKICFFEHQILVYIKENIFASIPNVFSRNAVLDNNKRFYIPESPGIDEIISFEIYDKWANPMFAVYKVRPGNPDHGWDGTVNGKEVETGVYVLICKLRLSNGRVVTYTGDVTILD